MNVPYSATAIPVSAYNFMAEFEISHQVKAVDQISEILPDLWSAGVEMGPIGIASPGELKKEPELELDAFIKKRKKGKLEDVPDSQQREYRKHNPDT